MNPFLQNLTVSLKNIWAKLVDALGTYHAEQYGMAMVIGISTYHVMSQMSVVEGQWWVAGIMGASLGFLNATFAFRFFEADDGERRAPAFAGMFTSVLVSVFIQYGFYAHASGLDAWWWLGKDGPNFHALLYGSWAPCFELLLGWSFGVRVRLANDDEQWRKKITDQFNTKLNEIQAKLTASLRDAQQVRDDLTEEKKRSIMAIERAQNEQRSTFGIERGHLNTELEQARSERDRLVQELAQATEQMNTLRAEHARLSGMLEGREEATPRRRRKTVKTGATPAEKIEHVYRFYRANPGASIRAAVDETGYSAGSISGYVSALVKKNRLQQDEQGRVMLPATVQMNGHHVEHQDGS